MTIEKVVVRGQLTTGGGSAKIRAELPTIAPRLMSSPEQQQIVEQLNLDENEELRTEILKTYLEDETAGANMIVKFASEKGVMITGDDVVEYMETSDDEFDIEIPMELLTSVAGGKHCLRMQSST